MKNTAIPIEGLHAFSYGAKWHLVHPERFRSVPITAAVGNNIHACQMDPKIPLLAETRNALEALNWRTSSAGQPKTPDRPKEIPVVSMDLFIAQQCTMHCIYCYGGGGEYGAPGAMEDDTAFRAVDWLWRQRASAKTLHINFFGGEPLLRFDLLKKAVSHARNLEQHGHTAFHFSLATNATLITGEIVRYLKENRFHINVGFDGTPDIQNRNRPLRDGRPSYEIVVPRIQQLVAVMPENVNLRATLWNSGELTEVRKALAELHPHRYQTQPASPGGHRGKGGQMPSADGEDTVQGIQEAADEFVAAVRRRDVQILHAIKNWLNFNWLLWVFDPPARRSPMCNLGKSMVAVSACGDVYPCHRFVGWPEFKMGSILEGGLDRNVYLTATYPQNHACRTCWAKLACNGGCPFEHQVRNGDLFNPNDHDCHMTRSLIETAVYLKHELTDEERAFLHEEKILVPRYCPVDLF